MKDKVFINEIFESIQGEGLYVGVNQAFIRFTNCNLRCKYCDTDFRSKTREYGVVELSQIVNSFKNIHSVSLTGGEPLVEIEFLKDFLPLAKHKIYLETNGVLYENLSEVIKNIDIISMDIKLPSCTGDRDLFFEHNEFIKTAKKANKELFLKIVFDENITESEIQECCNLGIKYEVPVILQPKMNKDKLELTTEFINGIFYRFIENYSKIRLIPQVHKFLKIK